MDILGWSPYVYHSLVGISNIIRPLNLRLDLEDKALFFSLVYASLDGAPKYYSLSYVWGPSAATKVAFMEDEKYTLMTPSLSQALRDIRSWARTMADQPDPKTSAIYIWADAICINQNDPLEKAEQILLMGSIYSQAENVLIHTGPETASGARFVDFLKAVFSFHPGSLESDDGRAWVGEFTGRTLPPMTDSLWQELGSFLVREWPLRSWIVQEFLLATLPVLLCGPHMIAYAAPSMIIEMCTHGMLPQEFVKVNDYTRHIPGFLESLINLKSRVKTNDKRLAVPLSGYLRRCFGQRCRDPRDHIYSLANLASDWNTLGIQIDYSHSVVELFVRTTARMLQSSRSLALLSAVTAEQPRRPSLPSWVPDWSVEPKAVVLTLDVSMIGDVTYRYSAGNTGTVDLTADERLGTLSFDAWLFDELIFVSETIRWNTFRSRCGWQDWLEKYHEHLQPCTQFLTEQHVFEALGLTLIVGQDVEGHECQINKFWKQFDAFVSSNSVEHVVPAHTDQNASSYARALARSDWRRWCRTRDGNMGLVPLTAQPGDSICLVPGEQTPFVIRQKTPNSYEFVGECYVHGVMNGEAREINTPRLERVTLV